jgi:hypothetical protein
MAESEPRSPRCRNDRIGTEIRRLWGDTPVVDAQKELRLFIIPADVEAATPKDPAHCVFAVACFRALGSKKVLFFRSVAYVELPQEDGSLRVERFVLPQAMRDLVADFDRGKGVIPRGGFLLRPPAPSDSLNRLRNDSRSHRDRRDRERQRAKLEGRAVVTRQTGEPVVVDLHVRSGSGAVHFAVCEQPRGEKRHGKSVAK